jgi:LEA14-like dessication related protein
MVMRRWIALTAVLCLFVVAGCATVPSGVEPVKVSLADISMLDFGLIEQKLGLKLRIQNPNNVEIPIEGLSYELELNGKSFADGLAHPQTRVPAFGDVVIDSEAVSNLSGLFQQIGQLQKEQKLHYSLKGKLYSSRLQGSYPFATEGEISLPDFGGWEKKLNESP